MDTRGHPVGKLLPIGWLTTYSRFVRFMLNTNACLTDTFLFGILNIIKKQSCIKTKIILVCRRNIVIIFVIQIYDYVHNSII